MLITFLKKIFDDSYKCYSINKLEGRVVEKWLNWLLPIKPDEKQTFHSQNSAMKENHYLSHMKTAFQ